MSESIPLGALQRAFARSVTGDGGDRGEDSRRAADAAPRFPLFDRIRADRDVPAGDRLWIYEHAQFARLHDVLREDFGALRAALGDDAFHDFAKLYTMAHPSRSYSLRFLGERFPAFLAGPIAQPLISRWPFAADLAAFEWTLVDLFDAPDDPTLGREALAVMAPERWPLLRFECVRASRLVRFDWPVQSLHEAWSADLPLPAIAPAQTTILFHRRRERVVHRAIAALEAQALGLVASGADFEAICTAMASALGDAEGPRFVLALLERWIAEELLVAIADPEAAD
ncbi:MAG: DNA-binding domain-containing protein [Myxococcota bacterium]